MSTEDNTTFKIIMDLMPRYDGNPKTLNYYIREVSSLINKVQPAGHPMLVGLIKSRLRVAAIDAIAYEESLESWDQIKSALLRRLGEPRSEIQVMQELMRTRRNRTEDAEAYGRRVRELLDTLYSVGRHSDKSYYENMAIDQYVNQLEFNVSIGVRILKPTTLELAIVTARQEEARLAYNKNLLYNNTPSTSAPKPKVDLRPNSQLNPLFRPNFNQHFQYNPNTNFVPQQNNWSPEQRQQWIRSMLPWKNQQTGNYRTDGSPNNFRNQRPNIPQQTQINPPQKVSDVTMRSATKPEKPQFAFEELFYAPNDSLEEQGNYEPYCVMPQDDQGAPPEDASNQDFSQEPEPNDQS